MALCNDDIMGLEGTTIEIISWAWRVHTSRASGKLMLACTYYGDLSDKPITEYLPIFHEGYAGQAARQQLASIAGRSGVDIRNSRAAGIFQTEHEELQSISAAMAASRPQSTIEYRRDGKFHRIINRNWSAP